MKKILVLAMALALVALLAVPLAALAAPVTTAITGDVTAALELQAPSAITTWLPSVTANLTIGVNTGSSVSPGVVKCNDPTGYNVTVASNKADGKMQTASGTLYTLGSPLSVTTGILSGVTVTTATQKCVTSSIPGETVIPLSVSQTIAYTDYSASNYAITLTYTATVGP